MEKECPICLQKDYISYMHKDGIYWVCRCGHKVSTITEVPPNHILWKKVLDQDKILDGIIKLFERAGYEIKRPS